MSDTPKLYLYEERREDFIKDFLFIKEMYFEKIKPAFENINQETDQYKQNIWKQYLSTINKEKITNIETHKKEMEYTLKIIASERYLLLSLMQYRTLAMWISLIAQVWEQQNVEFIKNEVLVEGLSLVSKEGKPITELGISTIRDAYKCFGVDITDLPAWNKIDELRTLVNVIKHGEGKSADKLRKARPDLFDSGKWGDPIELEDTSLNQETLNIRASDFSDYIEALIQFWNELPEEMFLKKV